MRRYFAEPNKAKIDGLCVKPKPNAHCERWWSGDMGNVLNMGFL